MRRVRAVGTCLALSGLLGGLAACSTTETPPPPTGTVAKQAGAADAATDLGPGKLATFVLEGVLQGVGAQGYSFLSDLLTGDSNGVSEKATADELVKIETQLQRITTRLDTIDSDLNSIKGQLADIVLSDKLQDMHDWNVDMTVLYKEYFLPISYAAKDVSAVQADVRAYQQAHCPATGTATGTATTDPCGSVPLSPDLQNRLDASVSKLNGLKSAFDDQFSHVYKPYSVLVDQHDSLYPKDSNVPSVLKLFGQRLETKGYTTWTDSQRLNQMYLALSDQEALTALLIFEHAKMFGVDAVTQERHKFDYQDYNKIERDNLATEIPWARVKVGSRLYMTPTYPQDTSHGAWLPISPEGKQLGTYNPLDKEKENPGWSLPTDAELTALFNGTKNTPIVDSYIGTVDKGPTTHLGSIWANSGYQGSLAPHRILAEQEAMSDFGQPWYWTKDTSQSNPLQCTVAQSHTVTRTYTLHHIGHMASDTVDGFIQGQPGRIPDNSYGYFPLTDVECDNQLVSMYNKEEFSGNVILTQPIPADVDYMAQRSVARQPPTTTPTTTPTTGS